MKVLIAEDESVTRRMLQRTMEKWGYEVVMTRNGVEALEAFRKERFLMVITDWVMPEMDGLELVQKIRDSLKETDYVYILMLTAKSEKEDLIVGMNAGADDFVAKPFDRDELRVRLRAGQRIIELEDMLQKRNEELQTANKRMKRDLQAAARIQNSLLPGISPENAQVATAWHFLPCEELAGDILNIFNLSDHEIGFYVLDVSGHGVPAALLSVTLSRLLSPVLDDASLLKSQISHPPGYEITPPEKVANQLNKRFQIDLESGQFFTMLYGIINTRTREMRYVSCGHPALFTCRPMVKPRCCTRPAFRSGSWRMPAIMNTCCH
ncbi:MAG: response regulator [Calditrichae bacterium]|nr:response regulator [Calditrichia bacterium]